jgi:purine-binding chemotaxis protein CheW
MNTAHDDAVLTATPGRYLTFHLGSARYAVSVTDVHTVIRMVPVTSVPLMPPHVRGVINLRGAVIAVIDLRAKFCMPEIEYNDRACILVFDLGVGAPGNRLLGVIVDAVDDVLVLSANQIEPTPDFASQVDARYLLGVATVSDSVFAILNIKTILAVDGSLSLPSI